MSKLYYQGHGSYRFTTNDGCVIYIDPYAGDGYDLPAYLILVTHDHSDHNQVQLVAQKRIAA
jgi:L-ascorbate metabolism protein UlaG (beta-lactamase superfamily)